MKEERKNIRSEADHIRLAGIGPELAEIVGEFYEKPDDFISMPLKSRLAKKERLIENRNSKRYETEQSIGCTLFTTSGFHGMFYGTMKNYSDFGLYVELQTNFKDGTILLIRTTSSFREGLSSRPVEGFRSISLSEVKWSKPIFTNGDTFYGIGLKHIAMR